MNMQRDVAHVIQVIISLICCEFKQLKKHHAKSYHIANVLSGWHSPVRNALILKKDKLSGNLSFLLASWVKQLEKLWLNLLVRK